MACMVERHASHPVVAEESLVSSLSHIEHGHLSAFHIIYIETLAIYRDIEIALVVICHAVDACAGKGELFLVGSRMRIVAVERTSVADPV